MTLLDGINNFHSSIKFIAKCSSTSLTFLDTKVDIDNEGRSVTDLYVKPTDTHRYLHRYSCHPSRYKRGIPYSQALRIRTTCSRAKEILTVRNATFTN